MKFRRIQAIILLLAILFNINSYTAVRADSRIHIDKTHKTGEYSHISDTPKSVEDLEKTKNELLEDVKSAKSEVAEDFSEDDTECRIIVELQGEPLIGEAINRGISYSQLGEDIIEEATRRIEKEQGEAFLNIVEELNQEQEDDKYSADLEKLERYSANFNGFVIKGDKRDLERIKENPYVKNVYLSEEYERPQLKHSNSVIGSTYAWDSLNYKGEKMVIAIIDTGVDYRHEAMRLSGDFTPKHSKNSIEEIISEYDLKGRYFTQKVPYGYNYYDHNHNLLDSYGSMHGMHVAGIAAANSETSQIKGVAPNAQILALKVFSDDVQYPTTFTDIWLKALDDAIRLKADVINMSLGAPAGILSSDGRSLQEMAISRAKKAGIAVVISAGNDGNIMSASPNQDRANSENPDTALISSPSLYHESFSVASSDNKVRYGTYLTYRASNSREYRHLINIVKGVGSQEIVSAVPIDLGNGEHEDYERHGDLTDKIIMFRIESEKFEDSNPDNNALQMQESARNKEKADDLKTERDDLKIESEKDEEELTNAKERAREEELTGDHNRDGESSHSGQESSDDETQEQDNFELTGDESTEQSIYVEEDGDISQQAPERASQQTPHHEHDTKKMTLLEKLALAKSKNPIAIIMYNSEHHGEHLGIPLSSAFPNSDYTIAIVGNRAIKEIVQELKANPDFELTLSSVLVESINISEGKISGFSSWGPTSDLKIKPEITAPGGNIYSTAEDDGYKALSGTSMASPHVAGAVAIMKQHLQSLGVSDEQMVDEIKLRLMNTARPIMYDEYNHTFVRQQGAGLMQLDKALKAQVGVKATGGADITQDGKLELGELAQKSFDFTLKLENHSEHDKSYSIAGVLIADIIQGSKLYAEPQSMNYPLFDPKEIFVEAGKTVEISYTVDFEIYDEFEENQFVEGFIFLHDQEAQEDERVDLSVPFLGFYGDWSKPLAIDAFHIPEVNLGRRRSQIFVNKDSHTVSSMFMTQVGLALPIIDNRIYFSPQSLRRHHENFYPWLGVRMAVLRNLDYVQYSILDPKTEEVLRVLGRAENVRKLSRLGSRPSFLHHPESIWDGTIQNRDIQNADRFLYEIKAALNTGSMQTQKVQTYRYMVELDSEQPQILDDESLSIEVLKGNKRKLRFKIQDSASGLKNLYLQSAYFVEKNTPKGQKEDRADPDIIGETPNLERYSPRYGNYLKIEFLQSGQTSPEMGVVDRANILKIVDNKLEITQEYLDLPRENPNVVYCNIGDNVRSEIEVNVVFKAQQDYVNISVNDRVLNAYTKFFRIDGSSDDYKIHFSNFYDTLSANHAVITVNDERVQDVDYQGFGKSKIKIAFPRKNAKLESLLLKYEGKTDSLIQNGEIQQEFKDLYNLTQGEFSIEFEVDKVMNGYSVFTKVSEFIPEDQMAVISFEKVDFSKLIGDKIIVIKDPERYLHIDIKKENSRFKYKKQKTHMIMLLKEEQEIAMMQLKSDQGTIYLLPAIDADEYEQMKEGYLQLKNRVFIKFDLKEDVEFSVTYDDGNFGFGTDSLKDENRQDPKDANNDQVTNGKYPIIILNNPKLLDIKRQPDLVNGKVFVDGFVGYIKDELESLKYSFVDKFGNLLSEEVEIPKSAITKEMVNFNTRHKQIYSGQAYVFGLYIKPEYFNANLRIEARSQGGERASIVRRWFFDDRFAQLAYHVQDRALSSEKASIRIRATDNSFKINLYKDDSYIDGVDLSSSSYESSDAVLEKIIEVPLQLGQNKIELKAVDLAKHESKKIIYIYRSHQ